jgi:hypothetical protein
MENTGANDFENALPKDWFENMPARRNFWTAAASGARRRFRRTGVAPVSIIQSSQRQPRRLSYENPPPLLCSASAVQILIL